MKLDVRSQNLRRILLLFNLLVLSLFALLPFLNAERWLAPALVGAYLLASFGLTWSIGLLDARASAALDERQQGVRDRAHRAAYPVVSWYVVALLLLTGLHPGVFGGAFSGLIMSAGLAVLMLPTMLIAWLEPAPVGDEPARVRQEAR